MPIEAIPITTDSSAYLILADAVDLAATLLGLPAFLSASDSDKTRALERASREIDTAMPYQGRRYVITQPRQFPRWRDEPPSAGIAIDSALLWDADGGVAIVPADVKESTLYQADAILAGSREARLAAQHDGVVYELTGTLAESYKSSSGPGVRSGLCRRAWMLMQRYRLQSGRLL